MRWDVHLNIAVAGVIYYNLFQIKGTILSFKIISYLPTYLYDYFFAIADIKTIILVKKNNY